MDMAVERLGHDFENITITGQTRAHLGNNYTSHHYHVLPAAKPIPHSTVPFARNKHFVGREHILEELSNAFSQNDQHNRAALQGLGGIGKSQLAIEFSYRYREQWPDHWVFYLHAGTKARFLHDYRNIATTVKLPGYEEPLANILSLITGWLCDSGNGHWLIIIDNADDRDILFNEGADATLPSGKHDDRPLLSYVPQSAHGNVLVTSRNHTGAEIAGDDDNVIPVGTFGEDDALKLLRLKLPKASDDAQSIQLVNLLDCVPLAISQAAAYIRKACITVSKYISIFRNSEATELELLGKEYYDIYQDSRSARAITTSWKLSFERIRTTSEPAVDALAIMSFMDRQGIIEDIIFEDDVSEIHRLEALGLLLEYSLIQQDQDTDTRYSMHRLVQVCTRASLRVESILESYEARAFRMLRTRFPDLNITNASWSQAEVLIPHARKLIAYDAHNSSEALKLVLIQRVAYYEVYQGNYYAANVLLTQALAMDESLYELCNISSAHLRLDLTHCHLRSRQFDKSAALLEQIPNLIGPNDYLEYYTFLFSMLMDESWLDTLYTNELDAKLAKLLDLADEHFGTNSSVAYFALRLQAQAFCLHGELDNAQELGERLLFEVETEFGPDDEVVLRVCLDLALVYGLQNRYSSAERLCGRALSGIEKIYDRTHFETLCKVVVLAWIYHKQRRLQEAESMYQRCLEGAERRLGRSQFDTLRVVRILARFYFEQEQYDKSLALYTRALAGEREQGHPNEVRCLKLTHNLGVVYTHQQRSEEAEIKFREAQEGSGGILARSYPSALEYTGEEPSITFTGKDPVDWDKMDGEIWNPDRPQVREATPGEHEHGIATAKAWKRLIERGIVG